MIVKTTPLAAYTGWSVREHVVHNGRTVFFDAVQIHGYGISPGFDSFADAVAWVKLNRVAR